MIVDFTKETSHKVKFKYNDSFVATAFDEIEVLLNRNDIEGECADGYLRPNLNNISEEKKSDLNSHSNTFDGCNCSIIMGTRGNAINLKSVTCEYDLKLLIDPLIPNAISPIYIDSNDLFSQSVQLVINKLNYAAKGTNELALAMGTLATLDKDMNVNNINGNNSKQQQSQQQQAYGNSLLPRMTSQNSRKNRNNHHHNNNNNSNSLSTYNDNSSVSRPNTPPSVINVSNLNIARTHVVTPYNDHDSPVDVITPLSSVVHPMGVSMSDVPAPLDPRNGSTMSVDSPSFRAQNRNGNNNNNNNNMNNINNNNDPNGNNRNGSVSMQQQIKEFDNIGVSNTSVSASASASKFAMNIISNSHSNNMSGHRSNNVSYGQLNASDFESIILAYQGNKKMLQSMNVQDLFVLETQLSNAIRNVRKIINVKNEQKFLCNICMRNEKQQCIDPCGHVTCTQCVDNSMDKCPICQNDIKNVIFLAM